MPPVGEDCGNCTLQGRYAFHPLKETLLPTDPARSEQAMTCLKNRIEDPDSTMYYPEDARTAAMAAGFNVEVPIELEGGWTKTIFLRTETLTTAQTYFEMEKACVVLGGTLPIKRDLEVWTHFRNWLV